MQRWREREKSIFSLFLCISFFSYYIYFIQKPRVFDFFQYFGNWAHESTLLLFDSSSEPLPYPVVRPLE